MAEATHNRAPQKGWLLAVLLVAPFLAQADATIANVATPSIHSDLGASGAALELVIGGYLVAFAVLLTTGARLGQTHGYRRVFLVGITVFSLASLACGLAASPAWLIASRVLQGAGAALMFPQALTGIQLNFSGNRRARAIGLYAIALSTGAVVGQILGGLLVSANIADSHWRAIFLVNVPIGLAAIVAALRHLPPDSPRVSRQVDLAGVATLSAAVLLIVVPLSVGRAEGWPVWALACLVASLPALRLFFLVEGRVAVRGGAPLVNVEALARGPVTWGLLGITAATGTYYALLFTLAQYLQDGLRHGALLAGLTLVPWVAAFGLAGQVVGRVPQRLAPLAPPAGCLLLTGAYAAVSAMLFAGYRGEGALIVLLGLGGFGLGVQFSALLAHLTTEVPADYAPDISGVTTTTLQIGGAVGVAAFGTLYLSLAGSGPDDATHAFAVVTTAFAGVASVAAVAAGKATGWKTARCRGLRRWRAWPAELETTAPGVVEQARELLVAAGRELGLHGRSSRDLQDVGGQAAEAGAALARALAGPSPIPEAPKSATVAPVGARQPDGTVRVAVAANEAETELLRGVLGEAGIPSTWRRTGGDLPELLAAGYREIYVPAVAADEAQALLATFETSSSEQDPAPTRRIGLERTGLRLIGKATATLVVLSILTSAAVGLATDEPTLGLAAFLAIFIIGAAIVIWSERAGRN